MEAPVTSGNTILDRVKNLHQATPVDPGEARDHVTHRCSTCVAGYDPATGRLVNAAWPCQTAQTWQEEPEPIGPSPCGHYEVRDMTPDLDFIAIPGRGPE
jgi:hypothetical protein